MNKYFLDSYAWIEYFDGTEKGRKVRKLIESGKNLIYTNPSVIAEVTSRSKRKGADPLAIFEAITTYSHIEELNAQIAFEAGILHADIRQKQPDFPLADALIMVSANKVSAKIVTGDEHFKEQKNVVFLV